MQEFKRIFNQHAYSVTGMLYPRRFKIALSLVPSAVSYNHSERYKTDLKMQEAERIFVDETV